MSFNVIYNIIAQDRFSNVGKKFTSVAHKIKSSVRTMNGSLENARKKFTKLSVSAGKAGKSMKKFGFKMSLIATVPIALLGRSMVNAASDAEETASKFGTVFRSIGKDANNVAANLSKNYGLASSKSKQLLSDTGDLLTGFGFSQTMALDLSNEVNKLAVDLASFTNFSGGAEGASAALTKALLGERESVKSLGISILDEDVKKKVAILRSKGMRFETMRQAKAFATLKIAQEQSTNAIGDYARTQKDYANTSRLLSARMISLKESFGKLMLPVMKKVTNVAIKLVEKFTALSPTTKKVILIIAAVTAVLGPLIVILGSLLAILPLVAAGFAIVSWPIVLIGAAIAAVIAIVTSLILYWEDLMEVLDNSAIWAGIKAGAQALLDIFLGIVDVIAKIMSFQFDKVFGSVKSLFGFDEEINANGILKTVSSPIDGGVANINSNSKSSSTVDVNLNAPDGIVKSVKSSSSGDTKLKVGTNMMATAQ